MIRYVSELQKADFRVRIETVECATEKVCNVYANGILIGFFNAKGEFERTVVEDSSARFATGLSFNALGQIMIASWKEQ